MAERPAARLVYSTGAGRLCPACGAPVRGCRCSRSSSDEAVPARIIAKLRLEKAGRGGKMVSVVYGLPQNRAFLQDLCQHLKRACGTGGAVVDGTVQLQGDLRERLRASLLQKGIAVKG